MKLNDTDTALLEQWVEDPSFRHWARQEQGVEAATWDRYFQENPLHVELAKAGRMLVLGIPFQEIPQDAPAATKALAEVLGKLDQVNRTEVESRPRSGWKPWRVAASIAALLFLTAGIYWQSTRPSEVLLTTEYGKQLSTQLPDGSSVILNANSRLSYHSESPREVWLEGEAFFEIKKMPKTQAPFLVHTHDMTVRVLGTSFNVKARKDQTKVFLEEGKVQLKLDDAAGESAEDVAQVIEMDPGDVVAYSKKQNKLDKQTNPASLVESASWKEGSLIFHNTPLPTALAEIEEIYGITFVLQSESIKQEMISGGVPIENLTVSLQTLREVYGLRISGDGETYRINGEPE